SLLSSGRDRKILEWNVATFQVHRTLLGEAANLNTERTKWEPLAHSPNGKIVALGSVTASPEKSEPIRLWDTAAGKELRVLDGGKAWAGECVFSPDTKFLVSGAGTDGIGLWDVATGKEVWHRREAALLKSTLAISPDGRRLACATPDKTIRLLEA